MKNLKESYEKIIHSDSDIIKEIRKEVYQMNDTALHNYANSIIREATQHEIERHKIKAMATTLIWDLINDILNDV